MILDLIKKHEEDRKGKIPLIASENVISPDVKEALISDLNGRYAEGLPGKRLYPGTEVIDEIEVATQNMMKTLFGAGFAEVRPLSGTMANLILYTAFTQPGDYIMRLGLGKGGHISAGSRRLGGTAGAVRRLNTVSFAFDEETFNIDVDESKKIFDGLVRIGKPAKIALFGASIFLYPHPIKELADYMKPYGTIIAYDAAHVAGLIAAGSFQDPLREGADIMTMSTHKTFFGPQHGAIVGKEEYQEKIQKATFPALTSNHHIGAMAGLGVACEEMLAYGKRYVKDLCYNVFKFSSYSKEVGLDVVERVSQPVSLSHQILLSIEKTPVGTQDYFAQYGLLLNQVLLPWDRRFGRSSHSGTGLRIGLQEVTRRGAKLDDVEWIASIIVPLLAGKEDVQIRESIKCIAGKLDKILYWRGAK